MPRKPNFTRRELIPDPKTGNVLVTRFINSVMYAGKRSTAERIVYGALKVIEQKTGQEGLAVLRQASAAGMITKTSVMLGLGETAAELEQTLRDARAAGCSIFYAGQYLQPTPRHLPVARYVEPAEFDRLRAAALSLGFEFVASAPLVRSSYHEDGQSEFVRSRTREGGVRN